MKHKTAGSNLIFILSCLPWAFFALYGDWAWGTALLYAATLASSVLLGWFWGKQGRILTGCVGSLVSAGISCLLALGLFAGDSYFKPFGAAGWVLVLSLVCIMVQYLFWYPKTQKAPWQSLLAALSAGVLVIGGAVLLMLLWSAWSIGAL